MASGIDVLIEKQEEAKRRQREMIRRMINKPETQPQSLSNTEHPLEFKKYSATERVDDWEVSEDDYLKRRLSRELIKYSRAVEEKEKRQKTEKSSAVSSRRYLIEYGALEYWKKHLDSLKAGGEERDKIQWRKDYAEIVKKATSTGKSVPLAVINQRPEFKKALDDRARYEKGLHTSFANRSIAINEQMKDERGYKVKRQDGKPITDREISEIAQGVSEIEEITGELHDVLNKTDVTIAHTHGTNPFLKIAGGLYSNKERTVTIGTSIMGIYPVRALAHELLGHWLDYESGNAEGTEARIYTKGGKGYTITAASEASKWAKDINDLNRLISKAKYSINNVREVNRIMRTKPTLEDMTAQEVADVELVQTKLTPYWYEPREIWARLAEQYIATKRGKGGIATDSPEKLEKTPGYWTKEEFAQMIPEVERQIKARVRVLRGSDIIPPRKKATPNEVAIQEIDVKNKEQSVVVIQEGEKDKDIEVIPMAKKVEPTTLINIGDTITDGIVNGEVLGTGQWTMGRNKIDGYRIRITSGHQRGQESFISKTDAQPIAPQQVTPQPVVEPVKVAQPVAVKSERHKYTLDELRQIQSQRTTRAQMLDLLRDNKIMVTPNSPKVNRWKSHPGHLDIRGIDNRAPRKAKKLRSASVKLGKQYYTDVGGHVAVSRRPLRRRSKGR